MAIVNINETITCYTRLEANLNNQLNSIMYKITAASRSTTELMTSVKNQRANLADAVADGDLDTDSIEYEVESDAINADYEMQMAEINSWESQLEQQKNSLEVQLKTTSSYKESFQTMLKNNIKKDFTYAGGAGS